MGNEPGSPLKASKRPQQCYVCPRLDVGEIYYDNPVRVPKRFASTEDAEAWLGSTAFPEEPEPAPDPPDVGATQGDLKELTFTNRKLGWFDPIPGSYLSDCTGLPFGGKRFSAFFQLKEVSKAPPLRIGLALRFIGQGTRGFREPRCYLEYDWEFERIQQNATIEPGHQFEGRKVESALHQLVKMAYELEAALFRQHRILPVGAVLDFWQSWQVFLHFVEFSGIRLATLPPSHIGRLPDHADIAGVVEDARLVFHQQVGVYCSTVVKQYAPESSRHTRPSKKTGPIADLSDRIRAARRNAGHTQERAAEEMNLGITTVREIEQGRRSSLRNETRAIVMRYIERHSG